MRGGEGGGGIVEGRFLFFSIKVFRRELENDAVFKYWAHLAKLQRYLYAPRIPKNGGIEKIEKLIVDNMNELKRLFPDVRRIPKQHYLIHVGKVSFLLLLHKA